MKTIAKTKRKWVIEAAVGIELMRDAGVWSSNGGRLPDEAQAIMNATYEEFDETGSVELEIQFQSEGYNCPGDRETPPYRHEERIVNCMTFASDKGKIGLSGAECEMFEEIFQQEIDEAELPPME